jgi:signal transduction histidine kinase/ligand-binding sensor domain-containing protein
MHALRTASLRRTIAIALTAAALGLVAPPVFSASSPGSQHARLLSEYTHHAWGAAQGAPAQIQAITQTTDGWLWLSSPGGLFRYDGVSFERMDAIDGNPLLSTIVLPVYAPPDGGLWVGYRFGGASLFKDGKVQHYGAAQGFPAGTTMNFTRATDGTIWAATNLGLAYFGAGRWHRVGAEVGFDPQPNALRQVMFARDGTQWVSTARAVFYRPPGSARFSVASPRGVELWSIAEGPDGTVWATDGVDNNYRLSKGPASTGGKPRPELPGSGIWFDRSGTMWLLRETSVERVLSGIYPDERQRITEEHGLSGNGPQCFFEDRDRNIWIGTQKGLDRFRPNRLHPLPYAPPLSLAALAPAQDGAVWVSNTQVDARLYDASGLPGQAGPSYFYASALGRDGIRRMGGRAGLWWSENGQIHTLPSPAGFAEGGNDARALAQAGDGSWWVYFLHKGVFIYDGGAWRPARERFPTLPDARIMSMLSDKDGAVWLGYLDNRIVRIAKGVLTQFDASEGLELGIVNTLYEANGHLWAGGEKGVAVFDGKRFIALGEHGFQLHGVSGLAETATGELWVNHAEGLARVDAAAVHAFLRGGTPAAEAEAFDIEDGVSKGFSPAGPFPTLVQATDGRLWISTASNVLRIAPASIPRDHIPPPVRIRSVEANGKDYGARDNLRLPQGSSSLHFRFSSVSLSYPERARYRYRLSGIDKDWQDAGAKRDAFYGNLGPGNYRFQVMAANQDGVWNTAGVALDLSIAPTLTQTAGFKLLCAIVLMLAVYLGYRLRVRQITQAFEARLQARLQERERIARTLHDTLLQGSQGAILMMAAELDKLPHGTPARLALEQAIAYAEEALHEGRDQVMELRNSLDPDASLAAALESVARKLAAGPGGGRGPKFVLHQHGTPYKLDPLVAENVFAIGREAILNTYKHASARCIEVHLHYRASAFQLVVRDDGIGIAPEVARNGGGQGHWGVLGMRERASRIGATLEIGPSGIFDAGGAPESRETCAVGKAAAPRGAEIRLNLAASAAR